MATPPKKRITARELMDRLSADPAWVAERDRQDAERARVRDEIARTEPPLLDALASVGHPVGSVWDLVNTGARYPAAIPVLLEHLSGSYPPVIREGIARALGVPEARSVWQVLARRYADESDARVKEGLAVALNGSSDETVLDDLIALARDRQHGASRLLLMSALARSTDPRAQLALDSLSDDPDLHLEVRAIARRKARSRR